MYNVAIGGGVVIFSKIYIIFPPQIMNGIINMCFYKDKVLELAEILNSDNDYTKAGKCAVIVEELMKLDISALQRQENCCQELRHTSELSIEILLPANNQHR